MDPNNTCCATSAITKSRCFFCGGSCHGRSVCATRNATCSKCKKEGHFSKIFLSNPKITSAATCSYKLVTILMRSNTTSNFQAILYMLVRKNGASMGLMDTGSLGSIISHGYVKKQRLQIKPATDNASMA